jgi:hypothetical protein
MNELNGVIGVVSGAIGIVGGAIGDVTNGVIGGVDVVVEGVTRPFRPFTTWPAEFFGEYLADRNKILEIATEIFNEADGARQERLIDSVLERAPDKISAGRLASVLEILTTTLGRIQHARVVSIAKNVGKAILDGFTAYVADIPLFRDAVFSNPINMATLHLIWSSLPGLIRFFMDLVECTKISPSNASRDEPELDDTTKKHGQYNELDFSSRMNRHAATCQLQRLILSVVYIWERLRANVDAFDMSEKTKLEIDMQDPESIGAEAGAMTTERFSDKAKKAKKSIKMERWLFINGIAGEYHWTRLGCEKLAKQFGRDVEGVMNRGDGILWDLIECAGERTAGSQRDLILSTTSSKDAQAKLVAQLIHALDQNEVTHVVIVAHSQGCLILRLALDDLIAARQPATDGIDRTGPLKDKLCVFTFGNPSVDWERDTSSEAQMLSDFVLRTEHFANEKDFVAKLGVLAESVDRERYGMIFKNPTQAGHLFGAQYSLDKQAYPENSADSWLLDCKNKSMAQIQKERLG